MSTILDSLIYNRTQEDIDSLLAVRRILLGSDPSSTQYKRAIIQFIKASKGAYNDSDFNRVAEAMRYLAKVYHSIGYQVPLSFRTDWAVQEIPTQADMDAYLSDLAALRDVFTVSDSIPEVPTTMSGLTYETANDIERILALIGKMLNSIQSIYIRAGMPWANAGNSFYVAN